MLYTIENKYLTEGFDNLYDNTELIKLYLKDQIDTGIASFEWTLRDICQYFFTSRIELYEEYIEENNIKDKKLNKALNKLVDQLEYMEDVDDTFMDMMGKIEPDFKDWKDDLVKKLVPDYKNILYDYKFNGTTQLYRAITLDSKYKDSYIDRLKRHEYSVFRKLIDGVGIYWARDKDNAVTHWGDSNNKMKLIFTIEAKEINVDWNTVFCKAMTGMYAEENEMTLKKYTNIKLTNIDIKDENGKNIFNDNLNMIVTTGSNEIYSPVTKKYEYGKYLK